MSGLYRGDAALACKAHLRGMRIGFLMDPLENVRVFHDSTFALMLECQRRGLGGRELRQEWLYGADSQAPARVRAVGGRRQEGGPRPGPRGDDAAPSGLGGLLPR